LCHDRGRKCGIAPTIAGSTPAARTETARVGFERLPGRRRRVTIDHRPLAGTTPNMLLWWFRNIGGSMS
jgi:hypothetical protein